MTQQGFLYRPLRFESGFFISFLFFYCLHFLGICARGLRCDALRGRHFIVAAIDQTPYINVRSRNTSGHVDFQGYSHEIVRFLAEELSFTFSYIEPEDNVMGAIVSGNWNGLVGMLLRDKADLASSGIAITHSRSAVIDFTTEIQIDPVNLLIPYPKRDSSIRGMLRPFTLEVWLLTIASLLSCSIALALTDKFETCWMAGLLTISRKKDDDIRRTHTFVDHFMFLLRSIVNPGNRLLNFGAASTAILVAWCLATVVITNSYTTSLKSYLTAPRFFPMIRSLDDVANRMSSRFLVEKHNSLWNDVMSGTSGTYGILCEALRKYPQNALSSLNNIENAVALDHMAFAQRKSSLLKKMFDDFHNTGSCRLYIAEKNINFVLSSFGLKKNNYITQVLSQEILWMHQFGFTSYLSNHYFWPRKTQCSSPLSTRPTTQIEKLSLTDLSSAFLLLVTGILLAIFTFFSELLIRI